MKFAEGLREELAIRYSYCIQAQHITPGEALLLKAETERLARMLKRPYPSVVKMLSNDALKLINE